jgi:exonuclease SbcC
MMQILSIHLKNIKSHRDTKLVFSPGINVLSGPNGVGKSTVFEAIGYALFGVDARDFVSNVDRFLTIGAKRGEISVTFAASDGDSYRVTRTVGTPATWRLAKEMDGFFEVEDHAGIEETEERIRELLGLSRGRSLAEQFKLVIGPFQSEFLGPFVKKQVTKRKEDFDEILGIDSWRKTFDGTKELGNTIKAKLANLETDIAGKEERIACLPKRQEELKALVLEEEKKGRELKGVTADLVALVELLQALQEKKNGIERLRSEIAQVKQSIVSGSEHIAFQKVLVEQAETAARAAEQARPGKERYEAAEKRLQELREREKTKQTLDKEITALNLQATSARQSADHEEGEAVLQERRLQEDRKTVSSEENELRQSLTRLVEEETRCQSAVDHVKRIDELFRNLPLMKIEANVPYLRVILGRLVELDSSIHEKNSLLLAEEEWKDAAATLEPLRKEREILLGEKARLSGKMAGLSEGEEKLREGSCPFFGEPCGNMDGKQSLEVFPERRQQIESEIATIDAAISAVNVKIAAAEAAGKEMDKFRLLRAEISSLEKERTAKEKEREEYLRQLDPAGIAATFSAWVEEHQLDDCRKIGEKLKAGVFSGEPSAQLVTLEAWETHCHDVASEARTIIGNMLAAAEAPLAAARTEKAKVDARIHELYRRSQEFSQTEKRIGERKKAATLQREMAEKTEREKQLKVELLTVYQDVEAGIREAEEERRLSQPDHERYLQAEPIAKDLPKRKETLEKYHNRLADLERDQAVKETSLREIEADYSPEGHAEQQQNKETLQSSEATLRESLKNLDQNRQRLIAEITELEKVQEEIRLKQEETRDLRRKEELVKFLRSKVFKNVSAQLSERFREEITLRADRIYRTISEADEELIWGDDYRIILRDMADGVVRERSDDQLSGGQTMSAVVALRLALLQTIGARFAFFDEPTSNLDSSRRENLAQAFRAIDVGREEVTEHWYDQLFLVSHDVAFSEITDQMIQLGEG